MAKSWLLLILSGSILVPAVWAQSDKGRLAQNVAAIETSGSTSANSEVMEPSQASSLSWLAQRRRPGAYLGFGLEKPTRVGKLNHYDVLYGKKEVQPGFFAGYYLYSYLVDLGVGTSISYYNATGNPIKPSVGQSKPLKDDLPAGTLVDKQQEIQLTLIPVQFLIQAAISPFASRRIVLRGWAGPEFLWVQESLDAKLREGSTNSTETNSFVNKGWNRGTVAGAMLSISLTGIEPRSDYALASMGIDRIFISPFLEVVKTNDAKMGNFDRQAYGIAFSFESLR